MFHVKRATRDSEERSFAGDAGSPREARRASRLLMYDLIRRRMADRGTDSHAEQSQAFRIPPGPVSARRLGHYESASHPQQGRRALRRHRRGPEASGHHTVGSSSKTPPSGFFGSLGQDLHPVPQAALDDRFSEEGSPGGSAVEQGPPGVRPQQGERETGQPPAAAEVHRRVRSRRERGPEVQSSIDVRIDRARPQKAPLLRFEQDESQGRPLGPVEGGQLLTGEGITTTRRRGSSPSETVDTPSISPTAS